MINGGSDRQNQLELLKSRFDQGLGLGQKHFESLVRTPNKKKAARIVMFQLEPEPGSAVDTESPSPLKSSSPKKVLKNKVLNYEKIYGQSSTFNIKLKQ